MGEPWGHPLGMSVGVRCPLKRRQIRRSAEQTFDNGCWKAEFSKSLTSLAWARTYSKGLPKHFRSEIGGKSARPGLRLPWKAEWTV